MTNVNPHTGPQAPHASAAQTVFFGIPLKARAVSKNWDWTVRDFNRTLASIYNQTNPNFRVLVGCHDLPALSPPTGQTTKGLSKTLIGFLKRKARSLGASLYARHDNFGLHSRQR
jgi:hypothetical protein